MDSQFKLSAFSSQLSALSSVVRHPLMRLLRLFAANSLGLKSDFCRPIVYQFLAAKSRKIRKINPETLPYFRFCAFCAFSR